MSRTLFRTLPAVGALIVGLATISVRVSDRAGRRSRVIRLVVLPARTGQVDEEVPGGKALGPRRLVRGGDLDACRDDDRHDLTRQVSLALRRDGDDRVEVRGVRRDVVDRTDRLSDADGFFSERRRFLRVAVVEQREDRATRGEKGVFRRVGLALEQTARTFEPAFRDAFFSAKRAAVPRDPDSHPGCRYLIAS